MKFNDVNDLRELEADLIHTPLQNKRCILAAAHNVGLIKLPWYLFFLKGIMIKGIMNKKLDSKYIDGMWNLFIEHVVRGTDTYGENDVGGLSEREFETFIDILETFGWQNLTE